MINATRYTLNATRYTLHATRYTLNVTRYTLIFFLIIVITGCATYELEKQNMEPFMNEPNPVWPPPPQTARIQYIKSIYGPSDIGMKKTWFRKAMETVLGKDQTLEMLKRPYGVFADSEKIYVTDPGNRLIYVLGMIEKKSFVIKRAGKNEFMSPIGIVSDKSGEIYISDSLLKRVFVFDKDGKYLREIGSNDLFIRPTGIAIDEERLYVVDTHGHNILIFSKKDGSFLFSFGKNGKGKGEFNYPTNIFLAKDNLLYITDSMNFRVQIFDESGNFISSFGKHGDGSGDFSKPKGIAVDSEGHIYIADSHFDTVQVFDKDGRLLIAFGNSGRGKGQMSLPAGLFIDEQDRIYVADSYNSRIQIFQYVKER